MFSKFIFLFSVKLKAQNRHFLRYMYMTVRSEDKCGHKIIDTACRDIKCYV